ncbi:MAG: bifunctional metallophosphatase/5'-nucleotidase [Proteobacteria bacterium]|nr:bifunctional metallophosphatase/5'-nucleotidase [Pseudomonadota bacterium]
MGTTKKLMGLWAVLMLACHLSACTTEVESDDIDFESGIRLTVIHTGDIHSRLLPYDMDLMATDERIGMTQANEPFGGIARAATVIRKIRSQAQHSVHVDSGDVFQGAPIFNEYNGEVEIYALNYLGMDAFIIGNHEFDHGVANLYDKLSKAQFTILAANYQWKPTQGNEYLPLKDVARPYTILNANGVKVAVIGMANYSSMSSSTYGDNSLGITVLENVQLVQSYIDLLRNDANILTMVTHLGLGEDEDIIRKTVGLDVVFGGHLHVVLNPPKIIPDAYIDINGNEAPKMVPLVHSGAFMKYVGHFEGVFYPDYTVRTDLYPNGVEKRPWDLTLVSHKYKPIPIESNIADDAELALLLAPYERELARRLNLRHIVGYAPQTLKRFGSGGKDSPLGNFLADMMIMRQRVESDFGATNSLGIRTDVNQGPVTNDQLYNVFPFPNSLASMFLSGTEVWSLLDFNTYRSMNRGCQSQIQVAGVRYTLDCHTAKRVVDDYLDLGYLFEYQYRTDAFNAVCKRITPRPSYCELTYEDPDNPDNNIYNVHFAKDITFVRESCETDADCPFGEGDKQISVCKEIEDTEVGIYKACIEKMQPQWFYKFATNNYMAHGGSGFSTLKYNTTQKDTGVALREVLIDGIEKQTSCYNRCLDDVEKHVANQYQIQLNAYRAELINAYMTEHNVSELDEAAHQQIEAQVSARENSPDFQNKRDLDIAKSQVEFSENPGSCKRLRNCKADTTDFEIRWCKELYKYSEQEVCLANADDKKDGSGPSRCAGLSKNSEYDTCIKGAYAQYCDNKYYDDAIESCYKDGENGTLPDPDNPGKFVAGSRCTDKSKTSLYQACVELYLPNLPQCKGLSEISEYDNCVKTASATAEKICESVACFIASTDGRQNSVRPRNENLEDEINSYSNGPAIMEALQEAGYDACY